ncbi:MAG: hypothetical protein LAN71_03030 [Acidobacteriia bacterium]|nr:hypothetical protein [Terriglobia bacterium]
MGEFPLIGLGPEDDGLHAATGDPWWREAWYFEFFDPRSSVQFQAYQGVFPNKETGDLCAAFFHAGHLIHSEIKMDFRLPASSPLEERLCFGPMRMEILEPYARWRIRYDTSDAQADLEFTALKPPFSWAAARLWMETAQSAEQRSQHFDQFGRYTGRVWTRNQEHKINAMGFRDRMWGWGGRRAWKNYAILWAGFDQDFIANVAIQEFTEGRLALTGYLDRDGRHELLRRATVDLHWDEHRWKSLGSVRIEAEDMTGRSVQLTGKPQGILDTAHRWPHRSDHMLFSVGEYRCAERVGHGVMNWAFATLAGRPSRFDAQIEEPSGGGR